MFAKEKKLVTVKQPYKSGYDILVTIQDSHYIQIKSNDYKAVFDCIK